MEDEDNSTAGPAPVSETPQNCHGRGGSNISAAGNLAASESEIPPGASKTRLPRPLSWLPTPRSRKNKVGRSISAPVLTSTTNAGVAQIEGVRCGELTQTDLVQSTWSPQAGWIADSSTNTEHAEKVASITEMANENERGKTNDTDGLKSEGNKPRIPTLSRLKGVLRGHLDLKGVSRRPSISEKIQFSKLEEGSISSTARRRAEGISLCKQKIRNLTGHGNVKRKPIEKGFQLSAKNVGERHHEEQPLLMSGSLTPPSRLHNTGESPGLSRHNSIGDLEQSFMNAVDKLNFHQTPQQTPHSVTNPRRQSLLPGLYQTSPGITDFRPTTTMNKEGIHTTRPEPCTFSASQAGLVSMPNIERRPKINPLKCHPNVLGFSEQLVDTSEVSTPAMGRSTPRIEVTKEEAEGLEHAPIYSPSSGNLSQYARLTPSPARSTASSFHTSPIPLLSPGNLHEILNYTPTRSSGGGVAADYATHQRSREMLARRSNPHLFSDYEQARIKENRRNAKPVDGPKRVKTRNTSRIGEDGKGIASAKAQQEPQASRAEGSRPAQKGGEGNETLGLSPYRVGTSKRVIGWAPLPASPGYRDAPPGRTTYDYTSDEDLSPTK